MLAASMSNVSSPESVFQFVTQESPTQFHFDEEVTMLPVDPPFVSATVAGDQA